MFRHLRSFNTVAITFAVLIGTLDTIYAQTRFVTVSLRPVANSRFDWVPITESTTKILGDVPFDILSSNDKNVWDSGVGTTLGVRSTQTVKIPVSVYGATKVHTLMNNLWGVPGTTTASISFVCSDGVKHTVALKSGENIRDWAKGTYVNTTSDRMTRSVMDWNIGRLDKEVFELPKDFASRTLTEVVITDNGVTGKSFGDDNYNKRVHAQRAFILGLTVETGARTKQASPFDDVTQKLLDDTVSKLKGPQAKQVTELKQKYKHDCDIIATQRAELGDEMQREVLKVMVLPADETSEVSHAESDMLSAIDAALTKAAKESDSTVAKSQCEKEILAAVDKDNLWNEQTRTRQCEVIEAAPKEKRSKLVSIYVKYGSKFSATSQRESARAEQYKKDLLGIVAPDSH